VSQPTYEGRYNFKEDPLWNYKPVALPIDALAWYQCDHLGTPQEITDQNGHTAWSAQYKAWGEAQENRSEFAQQIGLTNPIRFQGQYHDHETGLHYNRHRYYDPRIGRFISKDPIKLAGGLNLYAYAPNPCEWVDPLGLISCGLTGNDVGDASNLPVIAKGSKEWKKASESIKKGGKTNFRVADQVTGEKLLKDAKGDMVNYATYTDQPYKKGFEHHPNESHTNAPENNLPHLKWKDWIAGRKSGGAGHIFHD
ncbi:MAG: type IV secretion protein Rhs, partial [Flavobacterium sp.]